MALNPMQMMQMKETLEKFNRNHPRVMPFLQDAKGRIQEGTIIEVSVKDPSGQTICTNIRVNAEDMESLRKAQLLS